MPWVEPAPTGTATPEQLAGWEEVYGPDYPLSPGDIPVIQNSHVRVIYDNTNTPGFKLLAWNGTVWVEQGKVNTYRIGDSSRYDQILVSASVVEWSPHRAVIEALFTTGTADPYSRERVMITLQRGWTGPRVEVYAAAKQNGTGADIAIYYTPAQADTNDAAVKIDTAGAQIVSTAGSGSSLFSAGNIGAATFTGENELALIREVGSFQVNMAVLQPGLSAQVGTSNAAYGGSARNTVSVQSSGGAGYASVHFGFCAQLADQILEAESFRNTGSGTTSQVADAGASGGQAVKDTQTAETNSTLLKASGLAQARYRMIARVKVDSGATGSFRAYITGQWGTIPAQTSTSTSWVLLDLGDALASSANPQVAITGWRSAGASGAVYLDRVTLVKLEDRTNSAPAYDGARDHGQRVLYDLRPQPRLIARQ